ncbi:MAG: cobyric acid synthase [Thermodesulfobacteriota bacterium]
MTGPAKTIMFLGTGSDVGKSITAAAFCRIFKRRGYAVAPFKAQNMSNNSYITLEGGEIGRAQVVQAEAAGLIPSVDMNPILLKPSSGLGSQVVVQGRVFGQMSAVEYHRFKKKLRTAVLESFYRLAADYDIVVLEGAGSCSEINLKANDLVNFSMAARAAAPCVIVADIDRGGVFAQIVGSMSLLTRKEKALTAGFIVNKFRGDPDLFRDGLEIIRRKTGRPVFGLVPFYEDIHIAAEDSVAVQSDKRPLRPSRPDRLNIAVVKLPGLSNFTDLETLEREPDVLLNYLTRPADLAGYDLLVLPGTKNTVEDAVWLGRTGWAGRIKAFAESDGRVVGLCGGYQLLGREILDPYGVESLRGRVPGLGIMPLVTVLEKDKILRRVVGMDLLLKRPVVGYEIHMGRTTAQETPSDSPRPLLRIHEPGRRESWLDGWQVDAGRILGTYVHGLFDSPSWRRDFLNRLRRAKGLPEKRAVAPARGGRFHQYDRLADHYERHVDVEAVMKVMGL